MKTKLLFQAALSAVLPGGCASHPQLALQRNKDGKIQEITVSMDRLGQWQQLGWLPEPAKAGQ